jgi:hypothetical protein
MELLQNGVDRTVIALWVGHASVEITKMYLHADIELKERERWRRHGPLQSRPAATGQAMSCSPSWKGSDYADTPRSRALIRIERNENSA